MAPLPLPTPGKTRRNRDGHVVPTDMAPFSPQAGHVTLVRHRIENMVIDAGENHNIYVVKSR